MTAIWVVAVAGMLASAGLTRLVMGYARSRQMLDWPGARRSHTQPTPRGGGLAVAVVVVLGGLWLAVRGAPNDGALLVCMAALAGVAAIGWLDDHAPLSARLRLAVHLLAGALAAVALLGMPQSLADAPEVALLAVMVATAINCWNFMDGIDGLAGSQAALVLAAVGMGGWLTGSWRLWSTLALGSVVGFLPFNAPRARVFLGDVGSGALGCLIALCLLRAVHDGDMPTASALLLPSAFLIDAGATLCMRVCRGKRWWRPHREHLYQWLVRSGRSHGEVTAWYGLWTLQASAVALCLTAAPSAIRVWLTSLELTSGAAIWIVTRNRLWMQARVCRCASA